MCIRISYTFNDPYVIKIQVEYDMILLMRDHLCKLEEVVSLRITKTKFFITLEEFPDCPMLKCTKLQELTM